MQIKNGFLVGLNPASVSIKSATQNMPSGSLQPSVIDDYLHTELAIRSRCWSLLFHYLTFTSAFLESSPQKPARPLVLNDRIRKDPFMVQYMKVGAFIDGIMSLGRGTLLA